MKDTVNSILKKGNKCILLEDVNKVGIIKEIVHGKISVDFLEKQDNRDKEHIYYKIDELSYWGEYKKVYFNIRIIYEEVLENKIITNLYL